MAYRTPNYTHEQKLYFLQRIQGVVDKVQNFHKNMTATVQRNAAWNELLVAFNEAFPDRPPSTLAMLKTLWKRMKVESRGALIRRQEQLAGGMPVTALTEIQREVCSMVPNLVLKMEATADAEPLPVPNAHVKAEADSFPEGECDQKDFTASRINGSPDRAYTNAIGGCSAPHPLPQPHPYPASSPAGRCREVTHPQLEARTLELSEREHEQRMRVLLAEERVQQEKRMALKQKHKAYRYKKLYYRSKLQQLGQDVRSSSDDDEPSF